MERTSSPRRAGEGLAAMHGLPGDRTGRYRAAMGASRAWGPLRGQHRLEPGGGALWGPAVLRTSSCFPFTFRTRPASVAFLHALCAESTGSGPKLYHREARTSPFCYDQGLFFRRFSLFSHTAPPLPTPSGPARVVSPPAIPARSLYPGWRIRPPAGQAHSDPGWRHGHHDPALQAGRGRFPRRALCRPRQRPQGRQRAALASASGRDLRDPPPIPRGRRRRHRDQYLRRHVDRPGRLRPAGTGLRAEPGVRPAGARGL
ncbi:hypothetical protein FQZ97_511940 [compost metagenome]